jgi:hypothetical protein
MLQRLDHNFVEGSDTDYEKVNDAAEQFSRRS